MVELATDVVAKWEEEAQGSFLGGRRDGGGRRCQPAGVRERAIFPRARCAELAVR